MSESETQTLIVQNPDGTYTLPSTIIPATTEPESDTSPVVTKDLPLNSVNQTWVRIHLPRKCLTTSTVKRLPLIVYYHGSGFVYTSAATDVHHNFCNKLAEDVDVVVVNVEYRLAPKHRLPAAYEDGVEALYWVKNSQEPWLTRFADVSKCYVMGTSAGATMAYHAGLRIAAGAATLEPLKIVGFILHQPFFGGTERTESEIRLSNSNHLRLSFTDHLWELALPIDENNRDHYYCNPLIDGRMDEVDKFRAMGWRVLVMGRYGDLLIDRQMEFAKKLEEKRVKFVTHYGEGHHAIELQDELKARELFGVVSSFLSM